METKNFDWVKQNISLYFSNNADEKFTWSWSYNRLTEQEKNKICVLISKIR